MSKFSAKNQTKPALDTKEKLLAEYRGHCHSIEVSEQEINRLCRALLGLQKLVAMPRREYHAEAYERLQKELFINQQLRLKIAHGHTVDRI